MELEPGRRIGPYEILSTIGSGGMGTVYLARDRRLHRRVALKFIHPQRAQQADSVSRLLHEARAASALNHPNVCQVYDVGGEGRESWIAMEYVEGRSLAELIGPVGLPIHEVVRLGIQIADALSHAHSRGVLHRDLKTANIARDAAGRAKILDFGIAASRTSDIAEGLSTITGPVDAAFAGTIPYMAPEVIRADGQDERSDLWSFGVVLYEMATGSRPFVGGTVFDVASAIARDPAPQLPENVPPAFAAIVMRLLSKSPGERYANAAEVRAGLELLSTEPSAGASRARTLRRLAVAGVATAVVIAAGFLLLWRSTRRPLTITHQRLVSPADAGHRFPVFSPDGTRIVFSARDAAGVEQIWVRNVATGASIQLTHGSAATSRPRWLPDDRVLYAAAGEGLWVVPALGGTPMRLIEEAVNPDVSRDGAHIVFEVVRGTQRTLWSARSDGSDRKPITGTEPLYYNLPMGPALSPDGSQVAYFRAELGPNGDFWTIPIAGGTPTRVTSDLREGGWPVWTPDGRSIVFSSARAGSRTLWQVATSGGKPLPLTTGAGEDDQPDISRDGRQLTYVNVRNRWELRTREIATGQERTLVRSGLELLFPIFSPDGRRIAYFGRADEAVAIFTIGADGDNPQQLTGGRELNHSPRWSPDGKDIYFFQEQPSRGFRRIPAVGGPSVEFRSWQWTIQNAPLFDPTGRFIVYVKQRQPGAPRQEAEHTVIHEIASGRERVWPEPHTHATAWLAGDSILGWQHDPQGGNAIVICRLDTAACVQVGRGSAPKWSPADGRIYFLKTQGGTRHLWSIARDGTDERSVADLGAFRPIDVFFDISRLGRVVWAPFHAGQPELWTAQLSR